MTAPGDQMLRMVPALIVILLIMPAVVRLSGRGRRIVRGVTVAVFAAAFGYAIWGALVWGAR